MSQRVKVSITAVKDLEKLVEFLEKNGANIAEFFRAMNAGKPFVFHLDTSYYSQHKQELEKLCEYQEEKAEAQSSYGLTAIMLTDALIVLLISSYFVDGLELKNVLSDLFSSSALVWSLTAIAKILLSLLIYLGFFELLHTTPVGYLFGIRFWTEGNLKVLLAFMLLPIAGIILAGSPLGKPFKVFGIFLFIFFLVASLSGVLINHYRVRLEKV
ncbi:hypothetical protein Hydth_1636 [Hydrogenobacter thermophilus TK-6]|uniref:Uncharacterized protein n=1 Tax=Hydrogenobacter thermophilus (strain DSM 6534 / IAM 12695 / TK-6) TaxID=608538 RepID=D3DJU5_HYDTT|nr:hypothetical protein [Hydrogenobacter thermophilus]ADO46019.1 hypothetical protein Hydth_1636 [Hydrogenobacter thermophilus TK-6]BAI70097.1 hypothetical protein HTH_1650 [Hydrogenobacter thermophilus TK-6]